MNFFYMLLTFLYYYYYYYYYIFLNKKACFLIIYLHYYLREREILFPFIILAVPCTYFDAPAYGVRSCNKKTINSNNVVYEMICNIQCKQGYSFADPAAVNNYMCQSDGTWHKVLQPFGTVPVTPKSQKPWPDCARE